MLRGGGKTEELRFEEGGGWGWACFGGLGAPVPIANLRYEVVWELCLYVKIVEEPSRFLFSRSPSGGKSRDGSSTLHLSDACREA